MLGPNLTQGLNVRGAWVTQFVNPFYLGNVIIVAELQHINVLGLDGSVVTVVIEGKAFGPDITTHHKDDGLYESLQHIITGLDPQPDPPQVFEPEETTGICDDGEQETSQHVSTGVEPQPDPPSVFEPDETTSTCDDGVQESPQHEVTGLEPQPDPDEVFRDKETGSEGGCDNDE